MEFGVSFANPAANIKEEEYKNEHFWIMDFAKQTRRPMKQSDKISLLQENINIDTSQPEKVELFQKFELSVNETDTTSVVDESASDVVEPVPEVVDEPAPEVVDEPAPEVVDEPAPEVVDEPAPKVVDEPAPKVVDEPAPKVDDAKTDIMNKVKVFMLENINKKNKINSLKLVLNSSGVDVGNALTVLDSQLAEVEQSLTSFKDELLTVFENVI